MLGIPWFFFAAGYFWRHREGLLPWRWLPLCACVVGAYLAHLYSFVYTLLALVVLALVARPPRRQLAGLALAVAPVVALLVAAVWRQLPNYARSSNNLLALQYLTPERALDLAVGPQLLYFTSFIPRHERLVAYVAVGLGLLLALATLAALARRQPVADLRLAALMPVFAALYFVLPEYVSPIYHYFGMRVLVFVPLLALPLLAVPRRPLLRALLLGALAALALAALGLTASAYIRVNRGLADYAAALERIPAGQTVLYATAVDAGYIAGMTPFALFNGYYYLERPGGGSMADTSGARDGVYIASGVGPIPNMDGCCTGTLRSLEFRPGLLRAEGESAAMIFEREAVDPGGVTLVLSGGGRAEVRAAAQRNGYGLLFALGDAAVFRRVRRPAPPPPPADLAAIARRYDYLLIYQQAALIDPALVQGYNLIWTQGFAHLYRRRD